MLKCYYKEKIGFTLAEILITIGIVGIVALMAITPLLKNFQDAQYKNAYKKAYSEISQAFLNAKNNNQIVTLTGTASGLGMDANFTAMKSYFHIAKECDLAHTSECWDPNGENFRNSACTASAFLDSSGKVWRERCGESEGVAPVVLVDINGLKGPNKYGQDRFPFLFASESKTAWGVADFGLPTKMVPFIVDELTSNADGVCAYFASHPCYYQSWLFD